MNDDADIQASLEPVVLYRLDAEKGEGIEFAKNSTVKGYPTFIMLNGQGQPLDRWIGYSKDYLLSTMQSALRDLSPISEKESRFEANPTIGDAETLGRYNASLNEYKNAVKYYTIAQKINTDKSKDYTFEIFNNTSDGVGKELFTFEQAIKAADAVLASNGATSDDKYGVAAGMTHLAKKQDKIDMAAPYLEAGIKAVKGSEDSADQKKYARLMVSHSLYISKDLQQAVSFKRKTMPEGWLVSAGDLNGFCWWCFENKVNLKEAEKLSRKSVKLATPGKQKAMFLDTLAEICNASDNCHEAVELIKMAMVQNPDDSYYKKQLERFEKILASSN